jgi:hypothetical protein
MVDAAEEASRDDVELGEQPVWRTKHLLPLEIGLR